MKVAFRYFVTDLPSYFQWSDGGRELTWCNGTTVAFRQEIESLLLKLRDTRRYADFASVALAFAATRGSWQEISSYLTNSVRMLRACTLPNVATMVKERRDTLDTWEDSVRRLSLLHNFASDRRVRLDQVVELLALLLADRLTGYSEAAWEEITETLGAGLPEDWAEKSKCDEETLPWMLPSNAAKITDPLIIHQVALRIFRIIRIANTLASSIPGNTVDELLSVVRTGIANADSIQPTPELLPEPEHQPSAMRGLLKELENDRNLRGLARLTQRLIAAISLPRDLSEPDDLQMGGVSDISNRGPLDKLLLSELAHDDLTLSVRLALNEALYLRREAPPTLQKRTRSVLIDASLPMWGIPRFYATAAALALHVTTDRQTRVQCFRTQQSRLVDCPITTSDSVAEHLAALSSHASPSKVLPDFFDRVGDDEACAEPVVITTRDVLEMPEFRQQLDIAWPNEVWLIIAERDGRMEILQKTRQGMSRHRRIELPLSEILSEAEAETLRDDDRVDDLPAIYRRSEFPLLLPHAVRAGRIWRWEQHSIAITDDGRLMLWSQEKKGARQLSNNLPTTSRHKCFVLQRNHDAFCVLCTEDANTSGFLIRVSYSDLKVTLRVVEHHVSIVTDVTLADFGVLVFGANGSGTDLCFELELITGSVSGPVALPKGVTWRLGRVVKQDGAFYVMNVVSSGANEYAAFGNSSSYGAMCSLQKLPDALQDADQVVEYLYGHYALIRKGKVCDKSTGKPVDAFQHLPAIERISLVSDAGKIEAFAAGSGTPMILDIQWSTAWSPRHLSFSIAVHEMELAVANYDIRTSHHRFRHVGTDGKTIILKNSNGKSCEIFLFEAGRQQGIRMVLKPQGAIGSFVLKEFRDDRHQLHSGHEMQKAKWPSRGAIWLDSRGLLHLRSSDSSRAEVTLVLRDGWLAGWTSDGKVFGDDYYYSIDADNTSLKLASAPEIWRSVIVPLLESLI